MTSSQRTIQCTLLFASLALLPLSAGCSSGDDTGTGGGGAGGGTTSTPKYEPFALPAQTWSHGDPSPLEQELLELIQRARLNPQAEVDLLLVVPGVKSAMQQFGVDEEKLRDDFTTYKAVPPLTFEPHLMESSRFHSLDMAKNGFQEHDGSAGESFSDRIDAAGYKWSALSENIFAYAESVPYCHAGFMVDWGNPEPGHRMAILDIDGPKRDIGISIIEDPASPNVGPLVVTQDFGAPAGSPPNAQKFVVGVAFDDQNDNGLYDHGEGLEGLRVVVEKSDYYSVTSRGGGFSVPMPAMAGAVKVQLQDQSTYVLDQKEVTLSGDNVKVDFKLPVE